MGTAASLLQRVVLTGFMGSGKTTVGRLLAMRTGWAFLDLDDVIAGRVGCPVPGIFARYGEQRFREEEAGALADCLMQQSVVIALGGGAVDTEANRLRLAVSPDTWVVYLEGAFESLQARCLDQARDPSAVVRPLLADAAIAQERFQRRQPLYAAVASMTLPTHGQSPQSLADSLFLSLQGHCR